MIEEEKFFNLGNIAISQNRENEKKLFVCWGIHFLISIVLLLPLAYYSHTVFYYGLNTGITFPKVTIATILQISLPLIIYFFTIPISNYNLTKIHLKISRGEKFDYNDFFKVSNDFKSYCKLVLIHFIKQALLFFAVVIPASFNIMCECDLDLSGWSSIIAYIIACLVIIALLLISALLILKMLPFSMSYYVLVDNPDSTIKETLSKSHKLLKNHTKEAFKLYLSYFWDTLAVIFLDLFWYVFSIFGLLIIFLSFLAIPGCVVKTFMMMPKFKTVTANYYNQLKD